MAPSNPLATLSKMPPEILLLIAEAAAPVAPLYLRDESRNLPKGSRSNANIRARTRKAEKDMFSLLTGLAATSHYIRAVVLPVFWARAAFGFKITSRKSVKTVVSRRGQEWKTILGWTIFGMVQTPWTTMKLTKMNGPYLRDSLQRLELDYGQWIEARVEDQLDFPELKHFTITCKSYQSPCIPYPSGNWKPVMVFNSGMHLHLRPVDLIMKEWYQVLKWLNLETVSIRRTVANQTHLRTFLQKSISGRSGMNLPPIIAIQDPLEWQIVCGVGFDGSGRFNAFGTAQVTMISSILEKLDEVFVKQVQLLLTYLAKHPHQCSPDKEYDYYDTWQDFGTDESITTIYRESLKGLEDLELKALSQ